MNQMRTTDWRYKEINKTRVENVGFSNEVVKILYRNNIRTIGGIANRDKKELRNLLGISVDRVDEIVKKIKEFSVEELKQVPHVVENTPNTREQIYQNESKHTLEIENEEDVIRTLSERLGVTKKEVVSSSRKQHIVRARDIIAYMLREYGEMSYPAIGRLLGGRDHTTIIHAHKKIKNLTKTTPNFQQGVGDLIDSVKTIKERKEEAEKDILNILAEDSIHKLRKPNLISKKISDRNLKVLELYREGLTLENIGNEVGVSRERVRQIVLSTVKQMAVNEAISKGIVMDSEVLLEEEAKKRKLAQNKKSNKNEEQISTEKRWSRYYTSCQKCGTTTIPHVKKGLCEQCTGLFRGDLRENILSQHKNKCDLCSKTRAEAASLYGRDLYITKDRKVFCKACFRKFSGKRLGGYKNYAWSRFYPNCKSCGTTSTSHAGGGLCKNCSNKVLPEQREQIIQSHGNKCDSCGLSRDYAKSNFGRDLFITKVGKVLCKLCFHKYARGNLTSSD